VLAELARQVSAGQLELDQEVTIDDALKSARN
jgi:beta-lactamase class A